MVRNIARPEGNTTGFSTNEHSEADKWLGLLKEAAPNLARVAVIFNLEITATGPSYIASIEAAARALAVQAIIKMPVRNAVDIVRGIDGFATDANAGLLMLPPPFAGNAETIIQMAAQHRLPAIYPNRANAAATTQSAGARSQSHPLRIPSATSKRPNFTPAASYQVRAWLRDRRDTKYPYTNSAISK